jgi:hypothetical protein
MISDYAAKFKDYEKYFDNMTEIKEIEHIDDETFIMYITDYDTYDNSGILIVENRMAIAHSVFSTLYPTCKELLAQHNLCNGSKEDLETNAKALSLSTRIALCLNGENNTAYTLRKRLFDMKLLSKSPEEELHFIKLINMKFKKSSVSWAYRRHILHQLHAEYKKEGKPFDKMMANEFKLQEKMVTKYPRNYYAWLHRRLIVEDFYIKPEDYVNIKREHEVIKQFCEMNVHEYSAFSYLEYLILTLYKATDLKLDFEMTWTLTLIQKFKELYGFEESHKHIIDIDYAKLESLHRHQKFLQALTDGKILCHQKHKQSPTS